jgi:glycosyltransferase involved in cell wall biosynthesis
MQEPVPVPQPLAVNPALPLVVVCTPTYNRRFCLDFSVECYKRQTYPNLHWIIVDNSDDPEKDWSPIQQKEGIKISYFHIKTRKPVGSLRNVCLREALKLNPEFIAFWDDDDYYMPQRIKVSVEALQKDPKFDIIGCAVMTVFLTRENVLMDVGPYGHNHATAATYLFRAKCAETRYFLETANKAEEGTFTRDWTLEMIMLPAEDILLVIGHAHNTVNKSEIFEDQRKFGGRIYNSDNAKNVVRFQWVKDPSMWEVMRKTFLDA